MLVRVQTSDQDVKAIAVFLNPKDSSFDFLPLASGRTVGEGSLERRLGLRNRLGPAAVSGNRFLYLQARLEHIPSSLFWAASSSCWVPVSRVVHECQALSAMSQGNLQPWVPPEQKHSSITNLCPWQQGGLSTCVGLRSWDFFEFSAGRWIEPRVRRWIANSLSS